VAFGLRMATKKDSALPPHEKKNHHMLMEIAVLGLASAEIGIFIMPAPISWFVQCKFNFY
jgi:hypothetical protein